MLNIYNFSSI